MIGAVNCKGPRCGLHAAQQRRCTAVARSQAWICFPLNHPLKLGIKVKQIENLFRDFDQSNFKKYESCPLFWPTKSLRHWNPLILRGNSIFRGCLHELLFSSLSFAKFIVYAPASFLHYKILTPPAMALSSQPIRHESQSPNKPRIKANVSSKVHVRKRQARPKVRSGKSTSRRNISYLWCLASVCLECLPLVIVSALELYRFRQCWLRYLNDQVAKHASM